ncbi:efflux transporter outer membrane subunit [Rhodovastum sp. RN2-1]|uniref:Efflux transporter outer membrane subunit n=2 Tax=Limobrevibacterium gyesilva TaxID=2991712 RepID=A0AA41YJZ5_9PROT|nr:efflux transporter outer membrane subunit [Limobrevibacterium gyesilva]
MMQHRTCPLAMTLTFALLLGGCSLGPDYKSPALEVPAAYKEMPAQAQTPLAWPSEEWWRGFASPDLNGLVAETLRGNFDIKAAVARVQQADAQVRISGSPLLPAVDATGKDSWARSFQRAGGRSGYVEARSVSLAPSISYELDFWGRLRATQESAEASALFSRYDQQTVVLTAVTSVASTWFQALALQDRIDIARRNLADAEQVLGAITARQQVGTANLLDVSQQAALVAGLRAQIPGLQSQLAQQMNGLGILTGRPPEAITLRPGTLNTLALPEVAAGLPSDLLARRPDIAAAEAALVAANANIKVARADFFPQVTLTGSAGWLSLGLNSLFGPGSFFASAAASATQTIFDNGLKQGQFELAKGHYDELLAAYRKAVVQGFTDVDNAVAAYRLATEQEALERVAVATAQQAADIARAQLLAGTIDIVTALQAQTTLFTDLDTLAQVRLSRFQALLSLYKALGGGWSRSDVVPPASTIYHGVI